jgi:hypothetical protein
MCFGFFLLDLLVKKTKIPTIVRLKFSNFQKPFATLKRNVGQTHPWMVSLKTTSPKFKER